MTDPSQLPMFGRDPQSISDLDRHTPLAKTFPFFEDHLLREDKSAHTIVSFLSDLKLFSHYMNDHVPVGKLYTRHINEFLDWMETQRGVSCSRKTYARRVTSLKVFFSWLYDSGILAHDPALAVIQRSGEAPLSYALTTNEIERVLDCARQVERKKQIDTRPEFLFRLLLHTGIKKSEAMRLKPQDVHHDMQNNPYVHIHHTARNVYKERKIALPLDVITLVRFLLYTV